MEKSIKLKEIIMLLFKKHNFKIALDLNCFIMKMKTELSAN